jgi:hypothetical protein
MIPLWQEVELDCINLCARKLAYAGFNFRRIAELVCDFRHLEGIYLSARVLRRLMRRSTVNIQT